MTHLSPLPTAMGVALACSSSGLLALAPPASAFGRWVNPHHSVMVETLACGRLLCGKVVAASAHAQKDARDGGTLQLIGTTLLRDYRQTSAGRWQGRVFVPDRGDTFYSTIRQLDPNRLKISGCILGGLICKSQVWQRA